MKRLQFVWLALSAIPALAQMPGVVLRVDVDTVVKYGYDVSDWTKFGLSSGPTTRAATPPAFGNFVTFADIVAVNDKPAKGTVLFRELGLTISPTPSSGQAIGDIRRSGVADILWEFLQEDGTLVGAMASHGMFGGDRQPGTPQDSAGGFLFVTGGTGAFLGVRGQQSGIGLFPDSRFYRQASVSEDPANRRAYGAGGGKFRYVFHLIPLQRPEVVSVFHANFTPVSPTSPARAGETLVLSATGLGPTRPGVDPGQPFPSSPLQEVNSPLDVMLNGKSVTILNKVGWPGTAGVYRVDFRLPDDANSGEARLQLSAAWIPGPEAQFPVR